MIRSLSISLFFFLSLSSAGCSCAIPCDFPVSCVDHCGGTVVRSGGCGVCPSGSVPITSCIDASASDAGHDAAITPDVGIDAFTPSDAGTDAAIVCDRPGYPTSSEATSTERSAVEAAAADFTTRTGVTVDLDPSTAAVTGFSAPFPVTYDTSIADACMRALTAVQTFLTDEAAMMRVPSDIAMRACDYDSVLDMEVVRLHGGTYDGRRILGRDNDLVVHVTRTGTIRYWAGNYLPTSPRLFPSPCFNDDALSMSVVGDSLTYTHYVSCVPGTMGTTPIRDGDTRNLGPAALYVDAAGLVHVARQIEVLLDPSHVTSSEIESDLYCCGATLDGCVGNYLIVDEITEDILEQIPRCITC